MLLRYGLWLGVITLIVTGAIGLVACSLSAPGHRGLPGPHFDGRRFSNIAPFQHGSNFWRFLSWRWSRQVEPWQEITNFVPGLHPPNRVGFGALRVTFINHSTTLIQMDDLNILTDPIYSERASPVSWAGPKRIRPPGINFNDLPPIDIVVLSHNHYDHLDLPTLRLLALAHDPLFIVPLGNEQLLQQKDFTRVRALSWWETYSPKPEVQITATPAQHWSNRGLTDARNTLWASFVITGPAGQVYFAGDTGWGPHFAQIFERFGPMRLALLPIGAFKPRWFMQAAHISPDEAVDAAKVLSAGTSVAIHFGTFALGDDGRDEPSQVLQEYMAQIDKPPRFWVLEFGEGRDVPAIEF